MKTYYLRLLPKFVDIIITNANKTSNTGLPVFANAGSTAPAGFTSSPLPLSGTVSLLMSGPLYGSVSLKMSVSLSGSVSLLFSASVTATISEVASSLDELTSFPFRLTVAEFE